MKIDAEVTLKLSWHVADNSNAENNFLHKLLLTNTQVSKLCKAFANKSASNIEFLKFPLHKMGQSETFLGRALGLLLKMVCL